MANDVWSKWWQGDWELVLLGDGHAGEVLVLVLAEAVPMVLARVLLVCRCQLRGKKNMGVDRNTTL